MPLFRSLCMIAALSLLAACQTSPKLPDGVGKGLKIGKPYTINGETYYPEYDPHYSEEGIASWYGPGFHGKKTANGETYDMHAMTAAHKTLPMPSMVRVTNLKTGKTVVVKVTDRGPFKAGRIIDLSKAAAQAIDVHGIEKVQVDYLKEETEQMWADLNITPKNIKFAKNDKAAPSAQEISQAQTEYDRAREQAFYDESNVTDAAPIMSVSSNNVGGIQDAKSKKSAGFGIISNAEAGTYSKPLPPSRPEPINNNAASELVRADDYEDTNKILNVRNQNGKLTNLGDSITITDNDKGFNTESKPYQPKSAHLPNALDPPQGVIFVQAGAFASSFNADKLAKKIEHLGNVAVEDFTSGGRDLHRVRLGPFASETSAEDILHELFKIGIIDASIVAK